jgi:hypothetical protein
LIHCSRILYKTPSQFNLLLFFLFMSQHISATGGHLQVFNAKPVTLNLFMLWPYFFFFFFFLLCRKCSFIYKIVKMLKDVIIPRIGRCRSLSNRTMQHLFVCRFVATCFLLTVALSAWYAVSTCITVPITL